MNVDIFSCDSQDYASFFSQVFGFQWTQMNFNTGGAVQAVGSRYDPFVWDKWTSASGNTLWQIDLQENVERKLATSGIFTLHNSRIDGKLIQIECTAGGKQSHQENQTRLEHFRH